MMQPDYRQALLMARQKDCEALKAFAEDHLPLVAAMVRRFPPGLHEPEELYQQGCIGLMKAIARYRPESGCAFSTYAVPLILGEMRMLSRQSAPIHIPRPEREMRARIRRMSEKLTATLNREPTVDELARAMRMDAAEMMLLMEEVSIASADSAEADGSPLLDTLADADDWLTRVEMRDMLSHLPQRDQQLMQLRHIAGLTQAETAREMGMTQVQVSRREAVLRRELRRQWEGASSTDTTSSSGT